VNVLTWVDSLTSDQEGVFVPLYGADYIVFVADTVALGSGGPYDLKVAIRGRPDNVPPFLVYGEQDTVKSQVQVAFVTYGAYTCLDSLFANGGQYALEVRKLALNADSAKANLTIHDFGGAVKAAVVIVSLAEDAPKDNWDNYTMQAFWWPWNYKFGYTVEKHWKSGSIPWNVAWFDSVHVNGDVTVPRNRTLTVEPGTRVEFYPGDTQAGGQDHNRSELILVSGWLTWAGGKLVAEGAPNDSILFTSGASSPMPYDWYGVRMLDGSSPFEPEYCKFEYAFYPIICMGDTLAVNSCLFRSFGWVGIYASDTSSVTVENTTIDMSNGVVGIQVVGHSSGTVTGNNIVGSGWGTAGVEIMNGSCATVSYNAMTAVYTGIDANGESLSSSHNKISGFQNDGIKVNGSTVSISYDTLDIGSTGKRGIELTSTSSGTVSHNYITSSGSGTRYGIETSGDASAAIEYNRIDGPKYGIKCGGTSGPQIAHNWIKNTTGNGIQCAGDALPTVRYTTIENFQGTGVTAIDYSIPDLGAYPDSGSNRVYTSQSFSYYVANLTQDQISALYNWWGTKNPDSKKFYGDVDYLPCDTLDPGISYALQLLPMVSLAPGAPYATQSYPNPFNPRTTIEYGVSEPGAHVRVAVYDISGRVVRMLVDEPKLAGHFAAVWDGRNERGEVVASGVYFYEVVIGDFRQAKKLVVLR
jgi:hypothetical protein